MSELIETWRGEATNWECDELGHLNMRHYITKVAQARQMFLMQMGLPNAFKPSADSTVIANDIYIRYIAEARPGQNLYIETGLLELSESHAKLVHIMYHSNGSPAAAITETLAHLASASQRVFAWPQRVRDNAKSMRVELPDLAKPKGVSADISAKIPSHDQIKALGIMAVGRGVFQTHECDSFGRVMARSMFGRISESVGNFTQAWPEHFGPDPVPDTSGILLESKGFFHTVRATGDPFVLYSGLIDCEGSIRRLVHVFFDPLTDTPIAGFIAVSGIIDLKTRKLFKTRPKDQDILNGLTQPTLRP